MRRLVEMNDFSEAERAFLVSMVAKLVHLSDTQAVDLLKLST